jgi:hypothetical protein
MRYQAVARHLECTIRQSQDVLNAVTGSRKTSRMHYQAVARRLECTIRQSQDISNALSGSRKTSRMRYQAVARHLKCAIRQSQDISNALSGSRKTSSYTNLVKNSDRIIMTRAGFESVIVLIQLSIYIHSYKRRREVYTSGQLK